MTKSKDVRKLIYCWLAVSLAAAGLLAACSNEQLARFDKGVEQGQLFCAKVVNAQPLVVALLDASGTPVKVTGRASGVISAACAAVGGIPVSPPAQPESAPKVAAPLVLPAVGGSK